MRTNSTLCTKYHKIIFHTRDKNVSHTSLIVVEVIFIALVSENRALSGPLLHDVKLAPKRSEGVVDFFQMCAYLDP